MAKLAEEDEASFASKREKLLFTGGALDLVNVRRVNAMEAKFWDSRTFPRAPEEDVRVDYSENILGFNCGGSQNVLEVCFPVDKAKNGDLKYMEELLHKIESGGVCAPAPIEQRWTKGSPSPLSPAYSPGSSPEQDDKVYSWVGIIMYRDASKEGFNVKIDHAFEKYATVQLKQCLAYDGVAHWAKIPRNPTTRGRNEGATSNEATPGEHAKLENFELAKATVRNRFDIKRFEALRDKYDPDRILGPSPWAD